MGLLAVEKDIQQEIDDLCRENEPKGYKINPLLLEYLDLLEQEYRNGPDSKETYEHRYFAYTFIAYTYGLIGRFALAAKYYTLAINFAFNYYQLAGEAPNKIEDIYSYALIARNYYVDDDCLDLEEMIKGTNFINPENRERIYRSAMNRRRSFKHDPVEMSEEYLAVIDEVEEKIENNRQSYGLGSCHEVWNLKRQFLAEKGISWKSPAILNPRVRFD